MSPKNHLLQNIVMPLSVTDELSVMVLLNLYDFNQHNRGSICIDYNVAAKGRMRTFSSDGRLYTNDIEERPSKNFNYSVVVPTGLRSRSPNPHHRNNSRSTMLI